MLSFRQCQELIGAALAGHQEDNNIFRWIVGGYEQQIPYDDFIKKLKASETPKDMRTAAQILDDTEKLCARYGM